MVKLKLLKTSMNGNLPYGTRLPVHHSGFTKYYIHSLSFKHDPSLTSSL